MIKPLFTKFQKELVAFCNTPQGREMLSSVGSGNEAKNNFPIVKVTPDGFHQLVDVKKKRPVYSFTVFPRSPYLNTFGEVLTMADIAFENQKRIQDKKLLPLVFPHFMGQTRLMVDKLPTIMLTSFGPLYPDANPESSTVDGQMQASDGTSWANAIGKASADVVSESDADKNLNNSLITGTYYCERDIFLFDTSGIGAGQQITDATFSIYWSATSAVNEDTTSYTVVSSAPASNTAVAAGDFDSLGSTDFKTLAYTDMTQAQYNDFALNANGLANISITGISKFGMRGSLDISTTPPTGTNRISILFADNGSNKPKLAGNYSPISTGVNTSRAYFM